MNRNFACTLVSDALDVLDVNLYEGSYSLNEADWAVVARFAKPETDADAEWLRDYFNSIGEYKGFRLIMGVDGDCYLINTSESTIYYLPVEADFDEDFDELELAPL